MFLKIVLKIKLNLFLYIQIIETYFFIVLYPIKSRMKTENNILQENSEVNNISITYPMEWKAHDTNVETVLIES